MQAVRARLSSARQTVQQLYQRISGQVAWHADLVDWVARRGERIIERFGSAAQMPERSRNGYLSHIKGRVGEHLFNMQFIGAGRHVAQHLVRRLRLPAYARVRIHYADRAFTIGLGRRLEITDGIYVAEISYPAINGRPAYRRVVMLCAGEAKASVEALLNSLRYVGSGSSRRDPQQVRVRRRLGRFGLEMELPGVLSSGTPDSSSGARTLRFSADEIEVHPEFTVFVGAPRGSGDQAPAARQRVRAARVALRSAGVRVESLHLHHSENDVAELSEHLLEAGIQAAAARASAAPSSNNPQ
jgi:hypothetical protein